MQWIAVKRHPFRVRRCTNTYICGEHKLIIGINQYKSDHTDRSFLMQGKTKKFDELTVHSSQD